MMSSTRLLQGDRKSSRVEFSKASINFNGEYQCNVSNAYSPTVPLLEGQSRFLVQNLLLSRFFFTLSPLFLTVFLCTSLPLNLIILTVFIEFLGMSRF